MPSPFSSPAEAFPASCYNWPQNYIKPPRPESGPASTRLPDLPQDLLRVLAEPRRRMLCRHTDAVDGDRGAHARNGAGLGGGARRIEPHAAVDHLRIGEHVGEIVDRPR